MNTILSIVQYMRNKINKILLFNICGWYWRNKTKQMAVERKKDRLTERQKDRKIERQEDIKTEKKKDRTS